MVGDILRRRVAVPAAAQEISSAPLEVMLAEGEGGGLSGTRSDVAEGARGSSSLQEMGNKKGNHLDEVMG